MQIIPPNFHPFNNILWPLVLLTVMMFAATIVGLIVSRVLPRFLQRLFTVSLILLALFIWGWLVFFVHIFPSV